MLQFETEAKGEPLLARGGTSSSVKSLKYPSFFFFFFRAPASNFSDTSDYLPVSEAGEVKAFLFLQRYKVAFSWFLSSSCCNI